MTHIIIQARMGSSRLPGKMLMPLPTGGKPVIQHVVDRARLCRNADSVLLATTVSSEDDVLASYCAENSIPCFRGSVNDVLDRYYQAALFLDAKTGDYIVRITGDCPVLDPAVCDKVIGLVKSSGVDYVSSALEETFPDGLDCEAFRLEVLKRAHKEASHQFEREHVTQYLIRNPDIFKLRNLRAPRNLSHERWTLDEPVDYQFLCKLFNGIGKDFFNMDEALAFLDKNPELREINANIARNEGLKKSIEMESKE